MTKLRGYDRLREGDIKRGQLRGVENCRRRMDVDD
jgi:hypothetical protein